jgi:hypothetical protein
MRLDMDGLAPRGCSLLRRTFLLGTPCQDVAPAGDLLFVSTKSRQKATPAKPPLRGPLRCSQPRARAELASLRCAQTTARSQVWKRAARAPWVAALLGGSEGEAQKQPNSQQPNAPADSCGLFLQSPLEPAEQRKDLRARAQHASTTDSAQLSERSVAKRVLRGPSRPEQRRAARRAGRIGGRLLPTFGRSKVGRPPGRTPGTVHRVARLPAKATQHTPR